MAIINTQGKFNIGRDTTVVVVDGFGNKIQINNVTDFDSKAIYASVVSDRLDGVQLNGELPKGWTGSITFDRADNIVDTFIQSIEDGWFNGDVYLLGQIYQYVTEADGSQTVFVFDNVAFQMNDAGTWKGDSVVKCKLDFKANRRRQV